MKYGKTKWCYKCGGTKMKQGGHFENNWSNNIGFGQVVERRNLDQLPFFRMGGNLRRFQMAGEIPSIDELDPVDPKRYENTMLAAIEKAKKERKSLEWNNFQNKIGPMIGRGINFGTGLLAEFAGMYDRNAQQGYMNKMLYNPLSGILPFDDIRSDRVEEGYNMMQFGGMNQPFKMKMNRQGQLKFKGDINSFNNMFNSQPNYFGLNNPIAQNTFKDVLGYMKKGGEMIKRADGSYSRRGLWDNIRDNRGSGKKPTKQMLEQERKIKNK